MSRTANRDGTVELMLSGAPFGTRIKVGGHDISNAVQAVTVRADARGERRVTLELATIVTAIEGQAGIGIPDRTHDALVALGWAPPPDGA